MYMYIYIYVYMYIMYVWYDMYDVSHDLEAHLLQPNRVSCAKQDDDSNQKI